MAAKRPKVEICTGSRVVLDRSPAKSASASCNQSIKKEFNARMKSASTMQSYVLIVIVSSIFIRSTLAHGTIAAAAVSMSTTAPSIRPTISANSDTNLVIHKVGLNLAEASHEPRGDEQRRAARARQVFGPSKEQSLEAKRKAGELCDINHQADDQSANQSNSSIASPGAGVARFGSHPGDSNPDETDRLRASEAEAEGRLLNPNKCNLSKFWRPELCGARRRPLISVAGRHRNEVFATTTTTLVVPSNAGQKNHQTSRQRQQSSNFRVLDRVERSASSERPKRIPGANTDGGELDDGGGNNSNDDEEGRRITQPIDLDQQQRAPLMAAEGLEPDESDDFEDIDPARPDKLDWHGDLIALRDDELFLEKDPSARYPALTARGGARRRPASDFRVRRTNQAAGDVQTIYFGGFFPWLTEDEQVNIDRGRFSSASPETKLSQTSPSMAMIKANQQQQHQHQEDKEGTNKRQNSKDRRRQQRKQQQDPSNQHYTNGPQQAQQPENTTLVPAAGSLGSAAAVAVASPASTGYSSEARHQLGKFILPAVRLALDHINTNRSVLDSYKLEIVPRDTQCNATISLKEFFDMVYEEPKKMLLYGDACRVSTDPIAKASYFFDLIQISYADTDPIYTIENYPNFFRVVPSENALSLARIPFIRHFNWTRVGTIYQNLPRYSLPHSKLLTDLERFNIVIKQSVSLPGSVDALQNRDLGDELRKLKEKDVRIILGNFDEEWGLLLFCEAYREKMTGRKYQWILTGMSEDRLWQYYKAKGSSCSEQELLIAMDGYIVTDITPVTRSQHPTISGMMAHEYSNEYKRRALEMNISIEENKFYGYVYDGIWAIALALHFVDKQLKYYSQLAESGQVQLRAELQGLNSLLDFDYHKPIWVKLIRAALNRTRFDGVTGTVTFHKNERPGLISFSQFQAFRGMSEVIIGSYDALNDNLDLKVGFPIFWRGPSPPIDYTIERVTPFRINRTLFVIISILALFGIVLAFVFLTINIKFRDQRYIKMSSPYLNNLIIIGCILTYTSVIILGLDSGLTSEYNFPYICNARAWVLMAGFTLAFGSMFSKTFRVHSIFTNIKLHKKVIKDYKLFMVVFILLTFDVCILIVWQYFDPFYRDTNNGTSIQDSDNEDVIIVPEMEHCQSKRMTIFLSVIYVYKGLLMAFGCFLAWETRHVSIPALNDSKYIGLSVYNVVIMCVIGAGLSFVLRDQQDASFVIISIFIIFCSTTTLCLVFVPKLIELKQNPRAGDHRVRATLKTFKKNYHEEAMVAAGCRDIHGNLIGRGYGVNLNERIKVLMEENVKQRTTLKEKTYELEALTYKYRKIQSMVQSGQYHQAITSTLATATSGNSSNNLAPAAPGSSLNTSALPTTLQASQRDQDSSLAAKGQPEGKASFVSSTTQITAANTTSSATNNTTESTTDYSSSKPTSANGFSEGKRALVAFERSSSGAKRLAFERPEVYSSKMEASQQVANDSSYCSIGVTDNELGEPEPASELASTFMPPPDDHHLFTVFSYRSGLGGSDSRGNRRRSKQVRAELARSNFTRWSEGPFCTVMVRNNDQRPLTRNRLADSIHQSGLQAPGRAILRNPATGEAFRRPEVAAGNQTRPRDATQASCPDLAGMVADPRGALSLGHRQTVPGKGQQQAPQPRRQLSQPGDRQARRPLPRTISMIEYLGLGEFDLIASRHDKLLKRCRPYSSNNRRRQQQEVANPHAACCYEPSSCPCCGNVAVSSSEPLNSAELVQTSSRLSCSTCCSLASRSYGSQWELFDEYPTRSSQSASSETITSSLSESYAPNKRLSSGQLSSGSASPLDQEAAGQSSRACQHGAPIYSERHKLHHHPLHHAHHHHLLHHHPAGELLSSSSTSSSSSSSPFVASNAKREPLASAQANESSLCISGLTYCSPAPKEDANGTGQIGQPPPEEATNPSGATNSVPSGDAGPKDTGAEQQAASFVSIKCDVLESL